MTVADRFWTKVDKTGDCWVWMANRTRRGEARFSMGGRKVQATRVAYELVVGPIPSGYEVCHHCDNPSCVNPAHLFVGTHADNMRDMRSKGRNVNPPRNEGDKHWMRRYPERVPRGEHHPRAKVTSMDVADIRQKHLAGASYSVLMREYHLSKTQVSRIVRGQQWQ